MPATIEPRVVDLGGFVVRRSLPTRALRSVGPWLFYDHFGPHTFTKGGGLDVVPHPHINLATVTYLFDGEIVHRDSIGSVQAIRPGAINLMIAGRGIVHSERSDPQRRLSDHDIHGLQLWHGLPVEVEEDQPSFHHHPEDSLPAKSVKGGEVRVMMGKAYELESPVPTFVPTLYVDVKLDAGAELTLPPEADELACYVVAGRARLEGAGGPAPLAEHRLVVVRGAPDGTPDADGRAGEAAGAAAQADDDGSGGSAGGAAPRTAQAAGPAGTIHAEVDTRLVLIGGTSLGRRYMWWNFVSSRRERIEQAQADWRENRFPPVPGDDEYAPLPEVDRHARLAD